MHSNQRLIKEVAKDLYEYLTNYKYHYLSYGTDGKNTIYIYSNLEHKPDLPSVYEGFSVIWKDTDQQSE